MLRILWVLPALIVGGLLGEEAGAQVVPCAFRNEIIAPGDDACEDVLFSFHREFVAKAGHGIQFNRPESVCTGAVTFPEAADIDFRMTFLAEEGTGVEIWALTDFPLTKLTSLWTGGAFDEDPDTPQTPEWGWVYDRNGDGRVDWLSYIDGTLPVVPEGGLPEGFPNLFDGQVSMTLDQLAFLTKNGRVVYRHILDSDFDGVPDRVMAVPLSQDSGWGEGTMLVSQGETGPFKCLWRSDYDENDTLSCVVDDSGFVTTGAGPVRRAQPPLKALELYWLAVTTVAGNCGFGPGDIAINP